MCFCWLASLYTWKSYSYLSLLIIIVSVCLFSGTDEEEIIEILANRNNEQRQEIKEKFTQCFGKVTHLFQIHYYSF